MRPLNAKRLAGLPLIDVSTAEARRSAVSRPFALLKNAGPWPTPRRREETWAGVSEQLQMIPAAPADIVRTNSRLLMENPPGAGSVLHICRNGTIAPQCLCSAGGGAVGELSCFIIGQLAMESAIPFIMPLFMCSTMCSIIWGCMVIISFCIMER